MNFCSQCGSQVIQRVPFGDDRLRYVCTTCDTIHYNNPKIIVGSLPVYGEKILLCRRAIHPKKGYWTLPAGFMENSESTLVGAQRESWEEALVKLKNEELYRIFDLPHINQVYIFYRAEMASEDFGAGPESLEVGLFSEQDIPWSEIAYPLIAATIADFFNDHSRKHYPVRISGLDSKDRPVYVSQKLG